MKLKILENKVKKTLTLAYGLNAAEAKVTALGNTFSVYYWEKTNPAEVYYLTLKEA